MTIRSLFVLALIPALALLAVAQDTPIPYLEISPDTARVGDPVNVRIVIPDHTDLSGIEWPAVGEQLGEFHILSVDTLAGKRAKDLPGVALQLTVAAYDTGYFSTGPVDFTVGEDPWTLPADSMYIASVLADTSVTMRPLKSQADLKMTFQDWLKYYGPWVGGVLALILLGWLAWHWWTHRKRSGADGDFIIPEPEPYEQAMAAMAALKNDNPLARGDTKGYVSTLVFITKRLLEREFEEPILEMTSHEVRRWMKTATITFDSKKLHGLLSASDMVKFARGVLDGETAGNLYSDVESIIDEFRPRPELREQENSSDSTAEVSASSVPTTKNPRGGSVGSEFQKSAEPTEPSSWSTSSDPGKHSLSSPSEEFADRNDSDSVAREDRS